VWARVDVELTTHDAKGLTERDFELAAAMDRLASRGRV
jgi:4a-hydroxytetrahydrobiopterin dehydratase